MTLPLRLLIFALIVAWTNAAQPGFASEQQAIHMTVDDDHRMTITIRINGQEGLGILDTAATYALIDESMLTEQNSVAQQEDISILGVSGLGIFATAQIGPVTVGDINLDMIPAAVNAQSRFPGNKSVLPANSFSARVIDFDFAHNRITLYNGRPDRVADSVVTRLRYQEIMGLPFVEVKLNGKKGLALIDTGSDVTYINPVFARLAQTRLRSEETRLLIGANLIRTDASIVSARRLSIGRHRIRNFMILSSNPPLFEHLGIDDQPIMVLGLDTLRLFRLQIDREQKYVHLSHPRSTR